MKLIKNAIVYKAHLPNAELLRGHLEEAPFGEMTDLAAHTSGFVPIEATHELVSEFEGGLAFAFRYDEKIVPASAVNTEVKKRAETIERKEGYKPGRKYMREIKEDVIKDFVKKALVRSAVITCYYDTANQYLIIPVTSAALADRITASLIRVVGSMKTETIHISDIKQGLTTRLTAWLEGDSDAFGDLEPCDEIHLQRNNEKVNVKLAALETAESGLQEALAAQFDVVAIRFNFGSINFRLTSRFHFKGLVYEYPAEPDTSEAEQWEHESAIQLLQLSRVITGLCDLLGYKAPQTDEQLAA